MEIRVNTTIIIHGKACICVVNLGQLCHVLIVHNYPGSVAAGVEYHAIHYCSVFLMSVSSQCYVKRLAILHILLNFKIFISLRG